MVTTTAAAARNGRLDTTNGAQGAAHEQAPTGQQRACQVQRHRLDGDETRVRPFQILLRHYPHQQRLRGTVGEGLRRGDREPDGAQPRGSTPTRSRWSPPGPGSTPLAPDGPRPSPLPRPADRPAQPAGIATSNHGRVEATATAATAAADGSTETASSGNAITRRPSPVKDPAQPRTSRRKDPGRAPGSALRAGDGAQGTRNYATSPRGDRWISPDRASKLIVSVR